MNRKVPPVLERVARANTDCWPTFRSMMEPLALGDNVRLFDRHPAGSQCQVCKTLKSGFAEICTGAISSTVACPRMACCDGGRRNRLLWQSQPAGVRLSSASAVVANSGVAGVRCLDLMKNDGPSYDWKAPTHRAAHQRCLSNLKTNPSLNLPPPFK